MAGTMNYAGLLPLSWLYAKIIQAKYAKQKKTTPKKLNVPVISVGNLSVGGTGKTEAVYWICQELIKLGLKPGILSRGYKRKSRDPVVVVSSGDGPIVTAKEAGDEPFLLANRLKGQAAVIVGKDRYHSGNQAINNCGCQVLVLDDGFQRRFELFRDLELLLFDASDSDLTKGWVLPAGRCREPLANLVEADGYIITRTDQYDANAIEQIINNYTHGLKPIYHASHEPSHLINLTSNATKELTWLKQQKVVLISGIAKPQAFFKTVKSLGATICHHEIYQDHYWYQAKDFQLWEKIAKKYKAQLVMTTKDSVKINWSAQAAVSAWALAINFDVTQNRHQLPLATIIANLVKGQ